MNYIQCDDEDGGDDDCDNDDHHDTGIAFSLYMLFGEPFAQRSGKTYRPNWENIGETRFSRIGVGTKIPMIIMLASFSLWPFSPGPCLFASLISLVKRFKSRSIDSEL